MAELEALQKEIAEELETPATDENNAGKTDASADDVTMEQKLEELDSKSKSKGVEILEHKIIKPANNESDADKAIKQLQSMAPLSRGRPKKDSNDQDSDTAANGSAPLFTGRTKLRRTFVTSDELDKELEATMEKLEPGSSFLIENNGNTEASTIQDHDLVAILEGNDTAEVVTATPAEPDKKFQELELMMEDTATEENYADHEAEIALHQMMSLPKMKRGRKAKQEPMKSPSDLVSSIVDDWSDNEVEYEVTATESKANNETTITISPTTRKPANKSGAAKRKPPQGIVTDVAGSGSVEIIQTVEAPRIINKDAGKVTSPIKFERRRVIKKKVIWDPDDPTPPTSTRIGNTTIKKIVPATQDEAKVEVVVEKKPPVAQGNKRKRSGKSEIDKLLGDEGAVNMIYSVERETNAELPEIKTAVEEQLIDVEEEQNNLLKKANALKKAALKQTKSPPSSIPARAARAKRAPTPTPPTTSTTSTTPPSTTTTSGPTSSTKKSTPAKKRKSNQNESWDYVYKARQNEDSMIVRRRSNSSYSSTTSPRRLSLDQTQVSDTADASNAATTDDTTTEVSETPPPPTKKQRGKNFEFAKPSAKKSGNKKPLDTSKLVEQIRGKLKPKPIQFTPEKVAAMSDSLKKKTLDSKNLSIKKYDKFAVLVLPSIDGKVKDCLTLQLLNKIIAALKQLENDTLCYAVVITSAGTDFCRGINYNILVQIDEEKRSNAAREFASAVRKFIFALSTFPKPLICALQSGEVCGIGVTILPLFDIVLARDDVKLSAPYGLMGYFPEGLSILRLLNKIKTRTVSDMFYCNHTLSAEEAIEHELVTRTISKSNFNDDVLTTARAVVASSTQALLSIKATLTKDLIEQIDEALAEEEQILIQHWTSPECQEKFRNFLLNGHW